ncbi:ABC transporter ATP-binding protein [Natronolimnobius baerhuensis]|uniref:Copper ABC transporter ATP-binding protein n=1 Tax=Natronolimnobius baerhuensis TaxID=253108 RepID=A0A202E9R2_9EURY|nr:ABC transporter ATP-binding protein [Natronolimnobius baerhuensis]OVE84949.1 copper ABC transporter ATP-binding protein [Natronolimnobius baerhuensis]
MTAIETTALTKQYGDVTAVDGLELTVREGEVFGFLGPNGAGKSTTINMLLDFVRPTSGSATVLGYDAQTEADQISERVGILPEGFDIYPRLTGRRHVEFAIETKHADDDPEELLERAGLDPDAWDRVAGGYSTGMRQRLAMAMALVGDPDLLIMDEPSSGLDPHGIRELQDLVRAEADRGTTVFFSSHILEHVDAVCDRIGVLTNGTLVAVDTIDGLRDSLGGDATVTLTLAGAPDTYLETAQSVAGITEVTPTARTLECAVAEPAAKAPLITALDQAGATIEDVQISDVSLESLFTQLTDETAGTESEKADADADNESDEQTPAESDAQTEPVQAEASE